MRLRGGAYKAPTAVIAGLDPAIHERSRQFKIVRIALSHLFLDAWVIGERSDAVLRTAMPGHDDGEICA